MTYHDEMLTECTDAGLQAAFRAYFGELGCRVTNWEGLFAAMSEGGDRFLVRRSEAGEIIGFLMFVTSEAVTAWQGFFTTKLGCVEEFWITPACRRQGHGSALLQLAEALFIAEGCGYAILTTDTAPDFYRRCGYSHQRGVRAKNSADVYMKPLT